MRVELVKEEHSALRRGDCHCTVDNVSEQEWNASISLFDDATLYQTWAYGAVSWGEQQLSHLLFYRDGALSGAAQMRLVKVPFLNRGMAYLRWGPLWQRRDHAPNMQTFRAVVRGIICEYVHRRGLLLRVVPSIFTGDPLADEVAEIWRSEGFTSVGSVPAYRTIRVDLSASLEVIRKRLDQKWRNQLNRAERNGLVVTEGTDDHLFDSFIRIYDEMMERKKFETSVDIRKFAIMQRRLPAGQKMLVMLAKNDGRVVSGIVGAALGEMGVYLHGATSDTGMTSKGSYLLQWLMMQRLRERGCRFYDLGGINPAANAGVYHFKQGFGGQEVQQLQRFELCGNFMSGLTVRLAESVSQSINYLTSRRRTKEPQ